MVTTNYYIFYDSLLSRHKKSQNFDNEYALNAAPNSNGLRLTIESGKPIFRAKKIGCTQRRREILD